ncbi:MULTISPECIES: FkbM family methyltransferase [Mesorhizobium]|uniref:FkbM family methyltransferase n=1 Tax=Mesorhizobium TaxID=68287 RepID=UPI0010A97542|nr:MULTISPECIES: FkbM family methyltransferase [Mesorhizobium]
MRINEFFYLLGFKPNTRVYGHSIQTIDLPKDGRIEFARWKNPRGEDLNLAQSDLDDLRTFLSDGDVAVDVGAQVGDSTVPIALACGPQGLVLAFEPNPFTFAILGANAALNPTKLNIFPIPYAATPEDGSFVFDYGNPGFDNGGNHAGVSRWKHGSAFSVPVEGRRIEPLIRARLGDRIKRLRYIKTDVESHDLSVLVSISSLIDECRPYIKSEVSHNLSIEERVEMLRFFTGRGYDVRRVEPTTLFGNLLTENDLGGTKNIDMFAVPRPV